MDDERQLIAVLTLGLALGASGLAVLVDLDERAVPGNVEVGLDGHVCS